jgi:hypothetical protein
VSASTDFTGVKNCFQRMIFSSFFNLAVKTGSKTPSKVLNPDLKAVSKPQVRLKGKAQCNSWLKAQRKKVIISILYGF